jgi:hypothetical protein
MIARDRWRRASSTKASSRSGRCSVEASVTMRPSRSAARATPAAMVEKYGSAMSCTTSPSAVVRPRAIAWALGSGE